MSIQKATQPIAGHLIPWNCIYRKSCSSMWMTGTYPWLLTIVVSAFNYWLIFSSIHQSYFWDRISYWTWSSLIWIEWLISKLQVYACVEIPSPGIRDGWHWAQLVWGMRDLISSPCAFTASTLLTEPNPHLYIYKSNTLNMLLYHNNF